MTKTKTLTEAECHALTVRGDVPGVLDGYVGPVEIHATWHAGEPWIAAVSANGKVDGGRGADARLPLARPEVQAHLVGWLGRGQPCPVCKGSQCQPSRIAFDPDDPCDTCDGLGHLRAPHNRYAWLTPEAHGGLPDWIRMALIWGSVVRVAAGMGALDVSPLDVSPGRFRRCLIPGGVWNYYPGADAALLAQGHALIDNTPEGRVIRFEVPE